MSHQLEKRAYMDSQDSQATLNGTSSESRHILRLLLRIFSIFGVLYSLFFLINDRFPYVAPGADLVSRLKHNLARNGYPFKNSHARKVMAFGHSVMLAGFIPAVFDSELAARGIPHVESYNFGLPGDGRFVDDLEAMIARGAGPDLVLLIVPWPSARKTEPTVFHFMNNDSEIIEALFPFRSLPRNLFVIMAEARGNPAAFRTIYLQSEQTIRKVEADRGYYFIARQSHYPNDELPYDFTSPTDTPDIIMQRTVPRGPIFNELATMFAAHGMMCLFVPSYVREGEFAPALPHNKETAQTLANHADFGVVGPDYFLYPNRFFSDPTHANKTGAEVYTRAVARLVADWLTRHD